MSRSSFALTLSALLTLFAWIGCAGAADKSAASVFLKGMAEVCAPWQDGAERKALYASLKADGWNVDLLPTLQGPWGSARFQPKSSDEKRGCNAMLSLVGEKEKAGATKAVLDWVARTYPKMPMTNQSKPVQLTSGPVRAWTWADEATTITFYVADTVSDATAPHLVLSIKPR